MIEGNRSDRHLEHALDRHALHPLRRLGRAAAAHPANRVQHLGRANAHGKRVASLEGRHQIAGGGVAGHKPHGEINDEHGARHGFRKCRQNAPLSIADHLLHHCDARPPRLSPGP
jgi:hypothetical protein